jgi:membrane-bound lytic murein transglycosylase A
VSKPRGGAEAPLLSPLPFSAIEGWGEDDHLAAFRAFRSGFDTVEHSTPKTRALGIGGSAIQRMVCLAAEAGELDRDQARRFFERHFAPHRIDARGFVTGYFEPEVAASRTRTADFGVPMYRRPHDLADVADAERPASWDPEIRFARRTSQGLEPFFDRAQIETGALDGRGLELAWLHDPVDAFFIHVQGSARLNLADGGTMRIAFDGKSGHPYTSIGKLAVERGILSREEAHKDGLEAWLKRHPDEARVLMRVNRSFIFFRETELADDQGPMGAARVPLTPGRSLAVDRTLHTFHVPVWVHVDGLSDPDRAGRSYRRLMIAHDTGSAIVGPARGDLFFGSGDGAGAFAGRVQHRAGMVVMVPVSDPVAG